MNDKVSVIIPVYNASRWAESMAESIQENLATVGELLLVNDGDKEDFAILLGKMQASLNIPIHSLCTRGREGPGKARNIGIDHASFEYIAFLDCDDQWSPNSLEKRLALLKRSNGAPFVYSSYYRLSLDGRVTNLTKVPPLAKLEMLFVTNFIATPSVVIQRASLGNLRFKVIGHEDYDFWLRLIRFAGADAIGLVEPVVNVRTATGSVSSAKTHAALWHYRILISHGIPLALRLLLFAGYCANALLKRKIRLYTPLFFGFDHIMGWWLSQRNKLVKAPSK
jgi:teichuronic acid biosynthesis glycosyltransferase TuaG